MSIESVHAALYVDGLTPTEKLVLIGIANHDGDGGAWPSKRRLARYAGVSNRQVQRAIAMLTEHGLIEVDVNEGGNSATRDDRRPNLYRMNLPHPPRSGRDDERWLNGETSTTPRAVDGETSTVERGDTHDVDGETPMSPEPSSQPSLEPSLSDRFDEFWTLYPRREGKDAARRKWKTVTAKTDPTVIIDALRARVDWWARSRIEKQYIPHPLTWLNQGRWTDEIPAIAGAPTSRPIAEQQRLDNIRAEYDDAVASGNLQMGWQIVLDRAAATGDVLFGRIASMLEREDQVIAKLLDCDRDIVRVVRNAHNQVFYGTAAGGYKASMPELGGET